jgi:hypothetical protein
MRLLKIASLLLASAAIAGSVQAAPREGQEPVKRPPPPAPDVATTATANFGPAYRRAGSPKIVIFWNRHFDDEVASRYRTTTEYEEHSDGNGSVYGRSSTGDERVTSKRTDLVDEPVDWEMEGSFNSTLTGAGARLVDRTSIMRTQGQADGAEERANVQGIETRAVTGKADITVEILSTSDSRTSEGITYRIVAKDVRNAVVLADFTTTGRPPTPRMGLVASRDGGFERAKPPEPTADDYGRQLAVELMQALTRSLR